jgi:Flp pilus assembly protein TadD
MGYSLLLIDKKETAEKFFRRAANLDTNSYFAKTNRHYIDGH